MVNGCSFIIVFQDEVRVVAVCADGAGQQTFFDQAFSVHAGGIDLRHSLVAFSAGLGRASRMEGTVGIGGWQDGVCPMAVRAGRGEWKALPEQGMPVHVILIRPRQVPGFLLSILVAIHTGPGRLGSPLIMASFFDALNAVRWSMTIRARRSVPTIHGRTGIVRTAANGLLDLQVTVATGD